jgi:hypothetical protein
MLKHPLAANVALQPRHLLPCQVTSRQTAITILLFGAVFLAIGFTAWSMLRAEFQETMHQFSVCSIVPPDRVALNDSGGTRPNA